MKIGIGDYIKQMGSKKLYKGIDVFKLMAALGVVAIHTEVNFFEILGRLGVPFFVIVSSFFFFKHYFRLNSSVQRKDYIKKFLMRLGLLFLTWEFFYIPFAIIKFMIINNRITIRSVSLYIFDFFYPVPSNANGWGPSWYLIAMFMALPIFIGLFYLLRNNLIVLGILCVIIEFYFVCANGYGYLTHWSTLGTFGFPRVMIYIYIGMLFAKFKDMIDDYSLKRYLWIFGVLLVLFLIENFVIKMSGGIINAEEVFTTAPTALVGSLVAIRWQPSVENTVNIRNFSTFLYCAQQWGLEVWSKSMQALNINFLGINVLEFVFIVVSSYIFYLLYKWIKIKTQWKFWNYMV